MKKEEKLVVGKTDEEESILRICIDIDTDSWVKIKYNGRVIPEDKGSMQKAAIVFWDELKVNGLLVSKYNKCPNLELIFNNGLLNQLKDGRLLCENIPPTTYEMFYYIAEEYKKRTKE